MNGLITWKDMFPEEKDDLRERLDKAGIPRIKKGGARRKSQMRYRYKLSVEEYDKLFKDQNGKCAICKKKLIGRKIHIDHDHSTGKVRGLLHPRCNMLIGIIEGNPEILSEIKKYLGKK